MAKAFGNCSICMEHYDVEERIPKSLDCRHSFCALCLATRLKSRNCPACEKTIPNPDNAKDDLTMIDYLEKQQEKRLMEKQTAMRENLQSLVQNIENCQERTEAAISQFRKNTMKSVKEKSELFNTYAKFVMAESLQYCNTEAGLARIASKYQDDLQCTLKGFQGSLVTIKSLMENRYIGKEDFENCQTQAEGTARIEGKSENDKDGMWDAYRDIWLGQLTNISREIPYRAPGDVPGSIVSITTSLYTKSKISCRIFGNSDANEKIPQCNTQRNYCCYDSDLLWK